MELSHLLFLMPYVTLFTWRVDLHGHNGDYIDCHHSPASLFLAYFSVLGIPVAPASPPR